MSDDKHLERLRAMAEPDQQTWDLSPNDTKALTWAVAEIERLRSLVGLTATAADEATDVAKANVQREVAQLRASVSELAAGNASWGLTQTQVESWREAFPGIDVLAEAIQNANLPQVQGAAKDGAGAGSGRHAGRGGQVMDPVNRPAHYTRGGIECIDYLRAKMPAEQFVGFLRGNALKYLTRMGDKDDAVADAQKAAWYCNRLVAELDGKDT